MLKRKNKALLSWSVWAFAVIISFQNCSQGGFKNSSDDLLTKAEFSSTVPSIPPASLPPSNNPPTSAPPAPAPSPVPPSNTSGFDLYPGCSAPSGSFSRTLYIDAVNGIDAASSGSASVPYRSISYVISQKIIQPGDHVIVRAGSYTGLSLSSGNSPALASSNSWVWFDFKVGSDVDGVSINGVSKILITGAKIHKTSGDIVSVVSGNDIIVANNSIYSSLANPETLTVAEWMSLGNAVLNRNGLCNAFNENIVRNVRFGFTMYSDSVNPINAMVSGNDLKGFSADASRAVASNVTYRNNVFADGYASMADGDSNHDDFFQGFVKVGLASQSNILVENNIMLDRTAGHANLTSDYQGISIFDGLFYNVTVRNNVIVTGAYHGLGMYGVNGLLVENNTLISSNTSGKVPWLGAFYSKTGVAPVNNIFRNNIAPTFKNTSFMAVYLNNFTYSSAAAVFTAFNLSTGQIDLTPRSSAPFYGATAGSTLVVP